MFQLIYHSIAKSGLSQKDIDAILATSTEFNIKNNITGCLLYHNNEFIQILEGEVEAVNDLYSIIEKDQRHSHVTLLCHSKSESRIFPNWSMAFHRFQADELGHVGKELFSQNFLTLSEFMEKPTQAVRIFWFVAQQLLKK